MKIVMILLSIISWNLVAAPLEIIYEERAPYVVKDKKSINGLVASPLMKALQEAGVEYTIEEQPSSKRHLYEIKANQKPLCAIGWFKNSERERYAKFTKPLYQDQPTGILIRKDNEKLAQIQTVAELFGHPEFSVLVKKSYSYGGFIDEGLEKLHADKREVSVDNIKMLTLLAKDRADYLFISHEEAQELLKTHPQKEKLLFKALEGMPEGNKRYLICSQKTDTVLIDDINKYLKGSW